MIRAHRRAAGRKSSDLRRPAPLQRRPIIGRLTSLRSPKLSRQQFDDWYHKATGQLLDVVLETGAWQTILDYANSSHGIGFVSQSSVASYTNRSHTKFTSRPLSTKDFPPDGVRLIARKVQGKVAKELNVLQAALVEYINGSATQ